MGFLSDFALGHGQTHGQKTSALIKSALQTKRH